MQATLACILALIRKGDMSGLYASPKLVSSAEQRLQTAASCTLNIEINLSHIRPRRLNAQTHRPPCPARPTVALDICEMND